MDNTVTIPGYKYYLDRGERPDVCVAFLDVEEAPAAWVNGVCVPVDQAALRALDDRERNYDRMEITPAVEPAIGPTWTYVGRDASRARFAAAVLERRCVVARAYVEDIERGFRGHGGWEDFVATTVGHRPPLRDLQRVDLS
jgi:hypothetical protein